MSQFDWHSDTITQETQVTATYRYTQNVRRFLRNYCGADFKFDRNFMAWIKNAEAKTMGDVVREWQRRNTT